MVMINMFGLLLLVVLLLLSKNSNPIGRGTRITMVLKEDMKDYLNERSLKDLVKKHSEFIGFPIKLYVEKTEEKEVTDDEEEEEEEEETKDKEDKPKIEEVDTDEKEEKAKKNKEN